MQPGQQMPTEFSGVLELPSFSDRLPDLVQVLRQSGADLQAAAPNQTYIPFWEDSYAVAHNLKGVLKILSSPPTVSEFVIRLTEILLDGISGPFVCRRVSEAGAIFTEISRLLDCADPASLKKDQLMEPLDRLTALYEMDAVHEERLKEIPAHLFYVNEFVSKKAREIGLLKLNHCVVEDEILLDEIPLWRTQLNESLQSSEFGRGIVVNFLPFLSPEGSRRLKVWAWVAAATYSRAALKQRVKEVMPKVAITKL